MYTLVKELPAILQQALSSVGYARKDIELRSRPRESLFCAGQDGYRSFVILVNLSSNQFETHKGSWGGGNAFNPNNSVDQDTTSYVLPVNGAVIKGSEGGNTPVYACITLHPDNLMKLLPSVELSQEEKHCLYCYKAIKAGVYRQEELRRKIPADNIEKVVSELVERKYLKRSANGATQITTEGKNALESSGYRG